MDQPICQCLDCGKRFRKGDEGDNEKYCLRCEYLAGQRVRESMEYGDGWLEDLKEYH